MASETVAPKLKPTIRGYATMRDGRQVQTVAEGPGIGRIERIRVERNRARWNRGLRPNRLGLWR